MYQGEVIHKMVTIFLIVLSLFTLIFGNPIDKNHSVYDDLRDNCTLIETYSDFAKGCHDVTIKAPDHPLIEEADNILCVLLYTSLNASCPKKLNADLDTNGRIPVLPDICLKLPVILNITGWKSLSTVFEQYQVCKHLCEDTKEEHVEICSLSFYVLNQTMPQNLDKNSIVKNSTVDKGVAESGIIANLEPDTPQSGVVKKSKSPMKISESQPQNQPNESNIPEGDMSSVKTLQDSAIQKSNPVDGHLETKSQGPDLVNNNTEKSNSPSVQDSTKLNSNNNGKPVIDFADEDTKKDNFNSLPENAKVEDPVNIVDPEDAIYTEMQESPQVAIKGAPDEVSSYPIDVDGDSYFFSYFLAVCIIFVFGYVVYHNKQKILALIVEGRQGKRQYRGRRPNSTNYHKLDSNLEEAISSSCNKNASNIIY